MRDAGRRYLSQVQYAGPERLHARASLHTKYGRSDWFAWLAQRFDLQPGATVADVGCGAGAFWSAWRAARDLRLRLLDLSPGMASTARSAVVASGLWREVTAAAADVHHLPLRQGSVDAVIAVHMLHHLERPLQAVNEMRRVVRSGGAINIVLNVGGSMSELSRLIDDALAQPPGGRSEPLTSEQAAAMLEPFFGDLQVHRYDDVLMVTEPADLLAYILSLPAADAPGAAQRLKGAVEAAFEAGPFRISKAVELLVLRR